MSNESTPASDHTALVDSDRRNKTNVKCCHCGSLILKSSIAEFVDSEYELPLAKQTRNPEEKPEDFASETLRNFWTVKNIYHFENVGFSHTVNNRKYLVCADCEAGPIGFCIFATQDCYVALDRVKHE